MRMKNPCHMRPLLVGGFVLCLLLVNGIDAEGTCKKGCPQSDNGLLQYTPGNVYEYNFDSVMTVGVKGSVGVESEDTSLKISGTAKIFAEGNCGYTLQLGAVKVAATKESVDKKLTHNIQKPVHFTMSSGKVEPELCVDASDNSQALNVKRAIISLLQSNTEAENEVDVFGQCPTHTSVSKVGNAQIVTKVRNLDSCAYRETISKGPLLVTSQAGVKSTQMLQADYSKESKVERGVIDNVQLVEEYRFTATSKGGQHARAKVVTTLKLKNAAGSPAPAPPTGTESVSIIFGQADVVATKNIAALKTALSAIIELSGDYVHKDSAKQFVELIRLMRHADAETLLQLAAVPHPNKVLARKVYLDALFHTGTAESAKASMKQLNKMTEKEKNIAIISLKLVKTVDKDTVNQAAALLVPNAHKEVYLAIGNIVSKYCEQHGCTQADIDPISKKFTDSLKHCKANTRKDEERFVYILKGIGNTHHLASSVSGALAECAATGHSNRLRVAALQAFSAASCDPALQQKALELLKDHNEDSELRIEAYLAAIHCPNAQVANEIAEIVNSEPVYQVGGFIASNLKAIRDSTDETREKQRYHLGNIRVTKTFPKDFRRYSFNNEFSYKLDALGISESVDYKLIYSQQGFLPRSARLNVTTELYGTNFNIFEASIRQENIENVLEYYAGPKGLLNKDFEEIVKMVKGGGAGGRARRSIVDETGKVAKKYKTYGNKNEHDVNLDLSLKFFGSEMSFLSLGEHIPRSLDDIIMAASSAFEHIKKEASSYDKEFQEHILLLDAVCTYPTGVGLPLEASAQGLAANKLDFGVSVDVGAILAQNWQNTKYRLKVIPSVDVNVNMQLGFNAHVLATGIRVNSNLHSAVGSEVNVEFINEGNGFNVDINLPREKMELIEVQVSPEFYIAEQDKETKVVPFKDLTKHKDAGNNELCFNQLEMVGLDFCFATSLTSLGDRSADNKVVSADLEIRAFTFNMYMTSERKINLKANHIPKTATGAQQWKLEFSTPESKESHDTALTLELATTPRTYGRLSFNNPQYNFAVEAGVNNDKQELVVYGQYENNGDMKKNKIGFMKNGNEYRPVIEIQDKNGVSNNINGYHADGKVVVQKTGDTSRYTFENFQVVNKDNERVVVNGWADVGPTSLATELHIAPGQQSYLIKSNFKMANAEYVVGLFVNDERTPDNVIGGSAQVKVGEKELNAVLVGKVGPWEVDSTNEIIFVRTEGSITSSKFKHDLAVKNKNAIVGEFKLGGGHETPNKLEIEAEILRGKKVASASVKYAGNQRSTGDYVLEVNGKLNKHFVNVIAKCDVNDNHFLIDNTLTTSWGTALTAKGELGQRYTAQDIHIDLEGSAQFSGKDKPTQWTLKVLGAPEKTTSEFKLLRNNAELVKYTGEMQHPQDKITSGKVNLVVKNVLTAKADVKIAKNGKGEVTATIETQKTEQKHKIEVNSKFHVQAPKYDVETTLTFDSDKKIYFKTENILDKQKFATKNVAEVAGKQVAFDANGLVKGDWRLNGEVSGNFVLKCPEGHVVDGTLSRKLTTNAKSGVTQGTVDVQLNDQVDGKKRSLAGNWKIDRIVVKTKEVSGATHVVYTNFDGKKLELNAHVKHLPKGENKMIDIGYTVSGDQLASAIEASFLVDEYSAKHAVYRLTGKYGDRLSANLNGDYHMGERGAASTYQVQGSVNAPETSFKTIDIKSNGKLVKPDTETGIYVIELHLDEATGNEQFVKFNTAWKGSRLAGAYNLDLETKRMNGPLKLEGSYEREHQGSIKEGTASGKQKSTFNFSYGDKYVKSTADVNFAGVDTANMHFTLDSSFETAKDIDVAVNAQKLDEESFSIKSQVKQGGSVYTVDSKYFRATHKKGIEVHAALPNGKPVVVIGIFELLGERKAKLTAQIENLADLDFKANAESAYKSMDNFYVQATWNSAKLKLNDYDFNVESKGKAITFVLKNAQGPVFDGSATYALKKEKNKAIVEGQGQVQYKGKSQNTNFRLIRQIYDLSADKEIGFSYTFNGNFGPKNGVSTLKITNKEYNVKLSVCEEKKQCTNVQVQSLVTVDEQDIDGMTHSLLALIDLRELGYPYEFEFQSKTIRQGYKLQYSLDSNIVSNNNMKYQLIANVLPASSKVQLRLPQREILFETQHTFPEQGKLFGHYENSAAFWFDKSKKPNDVTRLVTSADVSGIQGTAINAKGEIKFEHPTIRPLSVSGKFDTNRQQQNANAEVIFDIFRTPEQQIVASSSVHNTLIGHGFNITTNHVVRSGGLGFAYEFNGHTGVNTESQEFSAAADVHFSASDFKAAAYVYGFRDNVAAAVKLMNEPIAEVAVQVNRQKYTSNFDSKLYLFGQTPLVFSSELQPTMAKISAQRSGLLDANAEIKLGKEVTFSVDGAGKSLLTGRIALDSANFLQTTYASNEEDVKAYLQTVENEVKQETEAARQKITTRFQKLREVIGKQMQLAKESIPDFSQLKANYDGSINEIVKELENDPSLKEITDAYHKLYTKFAKIAGDIAKTAAESYENLHKSFVALYEKWEIILKDTIVPAWEEFVIAATNIVGELRVEVVKMYTHASKAILSVLEKYGPALKNYGKAINDTLKPLGDALQELYKVASQATDELLNELKEYVSKLPTFEAISGELKDQIKNMKLAEKTLEFVNNAFAQLHILPQTPETFAFLEKAQEYISAKLTEKPINDEQVLAELLKLLVKAVRSIVGSLEIESPVATYDSANRLRSMFHSLPVSLDVFTDLPALLSFRFSVFNYLLNEDWESVFSRDHFKSWIFFHDFELNGHVADGHHFITFDGKHVSFPGTCKYILAQDSVDNNFTVVAQVTNDKLKSVTLVDRDGSFLEVTDTGVLKLNGNPVEFPQHTAGVHAWRMFYTVWLRSEYGVQVMCTSDLKVCHVDVNGFYTSKTRGLFGNGNAEPSDDFVQIDGTIAKDAAAFGSGYALGKCTPAAPEDPQVTNKHTEICNELFGIESTLAIGYLFTDVTPFREACDNAVNTAAEKDKEAAACTVATTYASALKMHHIAVLLPKQCLKCPGTAAQREIGQEFTVKIPAKQADVVFVVDMNVAPVVLANLVAPAITEVRDTLKSRGFTDVQIAVIAYNETQQYPALLTSDNGKLNYKGNVADLQLDGPNRVLLDATDISDGTVLKIIETLQDLVQNIVPQSDEKAFRMALNYPFRAGAAKSIVGVRSDKLEFKNLFKLVRAHITDAVTRFDGALLHMIGPVKDLSLDGVPTEKLVGFNSRLVATLDGKDAKKRSKLKFANDMGIDFVLNNGGWVFGSQNFESLKPQDQKKVLSQVTNSIADTLFKTEIVSDCRCMPVHGLHAQHKCSIKSSTFVPSKNVKAA